MVAAEVSSPPHMPQQVRMSILCLIAILGGTSCLGQDMRILLRPVDGTTSFHLGEPIALEAACVASGTERYLVPCAVVLRAEPISAGGRLTADRVDQTAWLDAQSGDLPPKPRGVCGTISTQLPSQQSAAPAWHVVTLGEPFPAYAGQYKIKAILAFDLEISERFENAERHFASDEVEIAVHDNLDWKNRLIHFHNCDYDDGLTVMPDADAIAAMSQHLDDCAVDDDESFATLLHEIVWLKMQVDEPGLYSRLLELEHGQAAEPGEANRIRQWFHDQYRRLLIRTARQLVNTYKSHPELHGDQEFQENLEGGFENWHDAAASLFDGADGYVRREEVADFLKQAGRSQKYVAQFLKDKKSDLPLKVPETRRHQGHATTSLVP